MTHYPDLCMHLLYTIGNTVLGYICDSARVSALLFFASVGKYCVYCTCKQRFTVAMKETMGYVKCYLHAPTSVSFTSPISYIK